MAKIQQCRNGCGQYITVQEDSGKWKPFDVTEEGEVLDLHNCPNSPYNQQQGGSTNRSQQTTYVKKSFPNPSTTTTTTTQGGSTLDTKRIFQLLKEFDQRFYVFETKINKILERIEYNTQVDTDKLIGQLQTIEEVITPLLKTQIKKASDIYTDQQTKKDPISVNHGNKADKHEQAFRDRRKSDTPIVTEDGFIDSDEFEKTKKFVPENGDVDSDDEDDSET